MKCPACGMDTPEAQEWCDFCKEPFNKKKKSAPAAAEPGAAAQAPPGPETARPSAEVEKGPAPESKAPAEKDKKVVLTPELLAKLRFPRAEAKSVDPGAAVIPPEFIHLDPGERIPTVPAYVRKLAWVFLTIVFIWIIVFTGIILSKGVPALDGPAKVRAAR